MWHRVTGINDEESRKKALRAFLFNRFHLSDMRFVGKEHVTGILTALRSMKARKNGNGVTPLRPRPGGGEAYRCG
jgi:hypothetical protein